MSSPSDHRLVTLFGLSYRTAPVEVRERLAFSRKRMMDGLQALREDPSVEEAVILSTCNRVEVYATMDAGASPEILGWFLCRFHQVTQDQIQGRSYTLQDRDAVRHLFRVSSGLDSQVVGETQVLCQVKTAYLRAKSAGHTAKTLNLVFQKALKVGKDVRTRTRIGERGASVASAAVGLMQKTFDDLSSKVVMVVGSGKMGTLTLGQLSRQGVKGLRIVNRSPERAADLASRFGGDVVEYKDLPSRLAEADIVITSTAAPHPIIRSDDVCRAMQVRKHAPQVYMDIAIPRDVEPDVAGIENVHLYNVDDLDRAIREDLDECAHEVSRGEEIVDLQVEAYTALHARLELGPLIRRMRANLRALIRNELARSARGPGNLPGEGARSLNALADRLAGKILHGPIQALQRGAGDDGVEEMRELVGRLFSMNGGGPPAPEDESSPRDPRRRAESDPV